MFSIRALTRIIPRVSSRAQNTIVSRPLSTIRTSSSPLQASWKQQLAPRAVSAFSTSRAWYEKEGEVDSELIAKLESEVQLEKDQNPDEKMPVSAKDYLENGPFKITDAPGSEIVTLTRQFGDEQITVTFSTDDINALEDDVDSPYPSEDDPALADEQESQSSSSNPAEATGAAEAEEDDELSGPEGTSYPARISVKVKKPGQGHLDIGTIAQDGSIVVESVLYVPEGKKSDDVDLYSPEFGNLDEDLQILLERYLDERGVNTALALFVPDYIDWKEQREYVRWLGAVKGFVEA